MNHKKKTEGGVSCLFWGIIPVFSGKYWENPRRNPIVNTSHKHCRL